jgi:shikimate kinase
VLIGLPGAGKTSVAPHAARLLESSWCDLDARVVLAARQSVADIFSTHGEGYFRQLERQAMEAALAEAPQVIATGGGWAAEGGNLDSIAGRALVVYLSIAPAEAARRLAGSTDRPMLATGAPEARLAELLQARERWYRLADIEIAGGAAAPESVAESVAVAARQYGGW